MRQQRFSFIWLVVLEVAAVAFTGMLYLLGKISSSQILWVLAIAMSVASAIFIVLALVLPQPKGRLRSGAAILASAARDTESVNDYMKLGRELLVQERYDEATQMFKEVLNRNDSSWQAYNYLGLTYSKKGLFEEARAAYEKAISLEFNYASAHFNLATACEKLGDHGQALNRWRQYIEVGLMVGERKDLLDHARQRVLQLEDQLAREAKNEVEH